ncbi:MAG TPA: hypothetical protein VJR89_40135 [Polyangiales bacterium]|nr:hypothetical protein [Polyangiales bacterium]
MLRTTLHCFVLSFTLLAACGADEGGGGPTWPGGPGAAGSAATVTQQRSSLIVENRFPSLTVTGIFLSPSYEEQWGSNQLHGRLLAPGQRFTVEQIPCDDYYDLKITGSSGTTVGIVKEIYFACGIDKVVTLGK